MGTDTKLAWAGEEEEEEEVEEEKEAAAWEMGFLREQILSARPLQEQPLPGAGCQEDLQGAVLLPSPFYVTAGTSRPRRGTQLARG